MIVNYQKRDIEMNKKTERKTIVSVNKRNAIALKSCKISTNLLKVNDDNQLNDILLRCSKQNQVIDVCFKNDKTLTETAQELLNRNMFTSLDYAIKRVKRHIKRDVVHAIAKRAVSIVTV